MDIDTIQLEDDVLSRLQSPSALLQLRFQLQKEQSLDQATQKQYLALYRAYFSVFAYLLGVLKDRELLYGEYVDAALYAITAPEWNLRKA